MANKLDLASIPAPLRKAFLDLDPPRQQQLAQAARRNVLSAYADRPPSEIVAVVRGICEAKLELINEASHTSLMRHGANNDEVATEANRAVAAVKASRDDTLAKLRRTSELVISDANKRRANADVVATTALANRLRNLDAEALKLEACAVADSKPHELAQAVSDLLVESRNEPDYSRHGQSRTVVLAHIQAASMSPDVTAARECIAEIDKRPAARRPGAAETLSTLGCDK